MTNLPQRLFIANICSCCMISMNASNFPGTNRWLQLTTVTLTPAHPSVRPHDWLPYDIVYTKALQGKDYGGQACPSNLRDHVVRHTLFPKFLAIHPVAFPRGCSACSAFPLQCFTPEEREREKKNTHINRKT